MNGKSEQILEEEREEIIRYGMKRGKVIIVSTLITILIGYFLGIPRQSIIFWFSLSILRRSVRRFYPVLLPHTKIVCI